MPDGLTALGNGVLAGAPPVSGRTTWVWHEGDPMATYLATATNGLFELTQTQSAGSRSTTRSTRRWPRSSVRCSTRCRTSFASSAALYGPYPFNAAGAIVDDAPDVGYALESQTKPNFACVPDETTLVHELAHQWFGDAVTLRQWPDIWLHEGFATWSEWIWSERHGGPTAQEIFDERLRPTNDPAIWDPPPGRVPSAAELFSDSVYDRGAMTLQALRVRGRRRDVLPHPARLVRAAPLRQRRRPPTSSPSPSATRTAT